MRRLAVVLAQAVAAFAVGAASASSAPGLVVGVADDAFLYHADRVLPVSRELGIDAVRVDLRWRLGYGSFRASTNARGLWELEQSSWWLRIVVAFYPPGPRQVPLTDHDRELFCSAAAEIVRDDPRIRDVIIGNEPNSPRFWQPQFEADGRGAAPRAYFRLLARCYDALHAARPDVNVIAAATSEGGNDNPRARSNAGHSPTRFVEELGRAYRASGRTRPLFDTVDHHPYPQFAAERPWRTHRDPRVVSQGDLARLVVAYRKAFEGTVQPTPGRCVAGRCAGLWLTETGFQSRPERASAPHYTGRESDRRALLSAGAGEAAQPLPGSGTPAPDQATQLRDALELAYCQPYVTAFFNFQVVDEHALGGWQSGVLHVDWSRKPSFDAFRATVQRVHARSVDCSRFAVPLQAMRRALR